jgi:DNA-directed RNA polymerase alpha subunit
MEGIAMKLSKAETLDCTVSTLPLSVRGRNVLKKNRVKTIGDLVSIDIKLLQRTSNCGKKTMIEIAACLRTLGFKN